MSLVSIIFSIHLILVRVTTTLHYPLNNPPFPAISPFNKPYNRNGSGLTLVRFDIGGHVRFNIGGYDVFLNQPKMAKQSFTALSCAVTLSMEHSDSCPNGKRLSFLTCFTFRVRVTISFFKNVLFVICLHKIFKCEKSTGALSHCISVKR